MILDHLRRRGREYTNDLGTSGIKSGSVVYYTSSLWYPRTFISHSCPALEESAKAHYKRNNDLLALVGYVFFSNVVFKKPHLFVHATSF